MYGRLTAYKKVHGNTKVPNKYERDPKLGRWVSKQRTNYNTNKMPEDRKELLDAIDFDLKLRRINPATAWEKMYHQLVEYKDEHGDTRKHY